MPTTAIGKTTPTYCQREPLRLPSVQKTISSRAWVSPRNIRNARPALVIALIAMPVSTSVTTSVRPPSRDMHVDEQSW